MEIKERIKKIIDHEKITYSKFSDIIGVQRSGISHILNGRNKPSLEIVQKILKAYKFLNSEWLILGDGEMYKEKMQGKLFLDEGNKFDSVHDENLVNSELSDNESKNEKFESKINLSEDNKKIEIERIVILYNNYTFSDYKKNNSL